MLNREYRDMDYIPRWNIVRTNRTQFLAGHSYLVAMYVNDLCVTMGLDRFLHLSCLQYALWHDLDEVFTGDVSGPAKRAFIADRKTWGDRVSAIAGRVFGPFWKNRAGLTLDSVDTNRIKSVIKTADWLEAACEMASEAQMGNGNVRVHMIHCTENAVLSSKLMCDLNGVPELSGDIAAMIRAAILAAYDGQSEGPMVDPEERAIAVSLGLISPAS